MQNFEKKRILLVEDELHIAEGIKLNLTIQGYDVKIASDGLTGINIWRDWRPELIILDVMLPVIDGLSLLKTIRKEDEKLPVLILSAKSSVEDKIHGLRCGVDDYLSKPFDLDELLLRVQRLITKTSWYIDQPSKSNNHKLLQQPQESLQNQDYSLKSQNLLKSQSSLSSSLSLSLSSLDCEKNCDKNSKFSFGGNYIDFTTGKASCQMGDIILTEQEIKLLKILIENCGRPVSRQEILEAGWGYSGDVSTRTLDNFIVRLRKYFEKNPKKPRYFKSRRAVGYLFDD